VSGDVIMNRCGVAKDTTIGEKGLSLFCLAIYCDFMQNFDWGVGAILTLHYMTSRLMFASLSSSVISTLFKGHLSRRRAITGGMCRD